MGLEGSNMSSTSAEKSKIENLDSLQIEYFSDLPISKTDVIMVESNDTIAITIRKFLTDINYENIYLCKNMKECFKVFTEFNDSGVNIPIVIDESVSNRLEKNTKEILAIQPNAKIIVITKMKKSDPEIAKLIDAGITSITTKPLEFIDFKKSFSEIMQDEIKEKIKQEINKKDTRKEEIESILMLHEKMSYSKLKEILGLDETEIQLLIKDLTNNQKIIFDREILQAECNQCMSTNIIFTSECPQCNGINFKQGYLIEHYSCGEVFPKTVDTTCPKCNKEVGSAGKDYREFAEYHICMSCNNKFPKPMYKFTCLKCSNIFMDGLASWKKTKIYKIQ